MSPEFRFYPANDKEALDGFYFAPVINFNQLTLKNDDMNSKASLSTIGGGAKIGWNWLLGSSDSFIIDLGLGAQYASSSLDVKSGNEEDFDYGTFDGMRPILNFGIGYAF